MSSKAKQLSAEQIAAINSYGKDIISAKNDIEAIKTHVGMYISAKGNLGFVTIFREIYQNAIDQVIDPVSPGDYVKIQFDEVSKETTIVDNGKGIPFDDIVRIYTKNHTSQNYKKVKGRYVSGINGIGGKATNAFSEVFIVESYRYDGEARRMVFRNGYPETDKPIKIPNKDKYQGTKITFIPSKELLGEITVDVDYIYNLVRDIAAMSPIGTVVDFIGICRNGKEKVEHIVNTDGINYFIVRMAPGAIVRPIMVTGDDGEQRAAISFTWDSSNLNKIGSGGEQVRAFCNTSPIYDSGSTNITGTLKGICAWFQHYINDIYLANSRSKVKVIANDVKEGLCVAIDTSSIDPQFSGQAKQKLTNEEMDPYCKKVVMAGLDEWAKNNPNDLQKIAKFIVSIATIRMNADKEKVKISANYESSAFSGMPAKYVKPTGKDHLELFICEGDSAKSPLVKCRDTKTNGIMPIRGKIISAFSNSPKEVFNNAEIQGILNILFGKKVYTPQNIKELTTKDCKYEKIIFTTDADER